MKYEEVKAKLIELFKSQSGDEWSESYEIIDWDRALKEV